MPKPISGVLAGVLAGAAGASALNLVTYVDQAIRARPASDTPQQTVESLSKLTGIDVPGDSESRQNRLAGLGPISGLAVAIGVGAVAGGLRGYSVKLPKAVAASIVGLAAMLVTDGSMIALEVTDPRTWTPGSVAADLLPHLAYGAVTTTALHLMLDPLTPQVR